jgi:hypothetical protein
LLVREIIMNKIVLILAAFTLLLGAGLKIGHAAPADTPSANQPAYTADGKLMMPANYRDWTYLTSGLGMNYAAGPNSTPMFTNVYVSPEAYRGFKATGQWPDKSMFIIEMYSAVSHGSINKAGHYQDSLMGFDISVKDSSRPETWTYYATGPEGAPAEAAGGGGCLKCHRENGAVENTFVQFYPTLLDFAVEKNLIKPGVNIPLNQTRFAKIASSEGWDKAAQAYENDRKKNPDSDLMNEHVLNMMGYNLLQGNKPQDAVRVFKLAVKENPDSVNAVDSLADGYAAAGEKQLALETSQKELEMAKHDSKLTADLKKRITEAAQKRIAELSKK